MSGAIRRSIDTSNARISNEARKSIRLQESNLKIDRSALEEDIPEWLSPIALEEYKRVISEAEKINIYDNLDKSTLIMYADTYGRYIEAVTELSKNGSVIVENEKSVVSPWVAIADKLMSQIQRLSSKLGLAATDRLRLVVPIKEEKKMNKFMEFVE